MTVDYRTPPHSYEAEQALLGAILMDGRSFDRVAEFLRPEHFADPGHGRIYEVCARLADEGKRPDLLVVKTVLERDGWLKDLGGTEYLAQLAGAVVSTINAAEYGKVILDMHMRREGIAICEAALGEFYDIGTQEAAGAVFERLEHRAAVTTEAVVGDDRTVDFGSSLDAALVQIEEARKARAEGRMVGVTTGLRDLDRETGGLRKSDLVILAGRPSMGKTALAYTIALSAAKAGVPVLFASLEMSHAQLSMRGLAAESGVPGNVAERGDADNRQFEDMAAAAARIRQAPLFVDDTPVMTPQGLRTRARRIKRKRGLGLIVVDYLQLMRLPERAENRVQEISRITASLKAIAKELDVPVLALSQLSRSVEQREDKKPQLSDLRESGSIEQDADVVMFVYREEYYLERAEPSDEKKRPDWQAKLDACRNVGEVIIAKQRRGAVGSVRLHFNAPLVKFSNLAREDQHYG